jgi:hypothetical protein
MQTVPVKVDRSGQALIQRRQLSGFIGMAATIRTGDPLHHHEAGRAGQKINFQEAQCPENAQAPGYDNDVRLDSWLRSDGTAKPGFDRTNTKRR